MLGVLAALVLGLLTNMTLMARDWLAGALEGAGLRWCR